MNASMQMIATTMRHAVIIMAHICVCATLDIREMERTVLILKNARQIQIIVIQTLPVKTRMARSNVHAILGTVVMAVIAVILMNARQTLMIVL